jgi:hypothetical protein
MIWGLAGDCYIRGVGKKLSLGQDGVYLFGFQTLPQARRRNVNTNLWKVAIEYYKLLGYSKFYILVNMNNHIVLRKMTSSGFIKLSTLLSIKVAHLAFLYEKALSTNKGKFEIIFKEPKDCHVI